MKMIATVLAASALVGMSFDARAMPVQPGPALDNDVVPVFEGCGPYGHRGPFGHCRPGGQWGGYVPGRSCPPGFHIGPYGRRCWPNRY